MVYRGGSMNEGIEFHGGSLWTEKLLLLTILSELRTILAVL